MSEVDFLADTRAGYDEIAEFYAETFVGELEGKPLDRALFGWFAELIKATGNTLVADIGCGPGWVTAHLDSLGLNAFGVDLSPAMLAIARRENPQLRFVEGSMTALDLQDLGGILANYSIIHIPAERRPEVFAGFRRALASGGYLMLVFQVGDEIVRPERAPNLAFRRLRPDVIAEELTKAGFAMQARILREPDRESEKAQQGYLLARTPR